MDCAALLQLTLFGSLAARVVDKGGITRAIALGGRPGSLLAYLALSHGKFFSRGELVAALWGEGGEAGNAGTLNTTLWRLRKTIERPPLARGDLIACNPGGTVGLNDAGPLWLDVDEFERLVTPVLAKPLSAMAETDVESLRRGAALYVGDVLSGFTDEWALRQREKHRRLQLNALGRLMQISMLARDAAGGIRSAQAILDLDALREDVHRELMRFFMLSGQRAMALRQFEICRAALKRELAIPPMRDTVLLYRSIADGALGQRDDVLAEDSWSTDAEAFARAAAMVPARSDAGDPGRALREPADTAGGGAARSPAELIASARRHLAAADAQLQMTLPLFDAPTPGSH